MKLSAKIKKELVSKTALTAREISSKYSIAGYSDKVSIVIKNERFPISTVEAIANEYRSVDYCQYSGEILAGGNTYISVNYPSVWDSSLSEEFTTEILKAVEGFDNFTFPVDFSEMERNHIKNGQASKLLMKHLNETTEFTYTETDTRAIWARVKK